MNPNNRLPAKALESSVSESSERNEVDKGSHEPALLFRAPNHAEKNHDYDPNWDYEVDMSPDPRLSALASRAASDTYQELLASGVIETWMYGFEVWAVKLGADAVAMYIAGTYDWPVILLDLEKHIGYEDQFAKSIRHELKHAKQESADEEFDEDEAEDDD